MDAALWKAGKIVDVARSGAAYAINNAPSPQSTGTCKSSNGNASFLWQNGSLRTLPFSVGYGLNDNVEIVGSLFGSGQP